MTSPVASITSRRVAQVTASRRVRAAAWLCAVGILTVIGIAGAGSMVWRGEETGGRNSTHPSTFDWSLDADGAGQASSGQVQGQLTLAPRRRSATLKMNPATKNSQGDEDDLVGRSGEEDEVADADRGSTNQSGLNCSAGFPRPSAAAESCGPVRKSEEGWIAGHVPVWHRSADQSRQSAMFRAHAVQLVEKLLRRAVIRGSKGEPRGSAAYTPAFIDYFMKRFTEFVGDLAALHDTVEGLALPTGNDVPRMPSVLLVSDGYRNTQLARFRYVHSFFLNRMFRNDSKLLQFRSRMLQAISAQIQRRPVVFVWCLDDMEMNWAARWIAPSTFGVALNRFLQKYRTFSFYFLSWNPALVSSGTGHIGERVVPIPDVHFAYGVPRHAEGERRLWSHRSHGASWRGSTTGIDPRGYQYTSRYRMVEMLRWAETRRLVPECPASPSAAAAIFRDTVARCRWSTDQRGNEDHIRKRDSDPQQRRRVQAATARALTAGSHTSANSSRPRHVDPRSQQLLLFDVFFSRVLQNAAVPEGFVRHGLGLKEQAGYRVMLDVDGNANAWNSMRWKLHSGSVLLKLETEQFVQWYYPDLTSGVHLIVAASAPSAGVVVAGTDAANGHSSASDNEDFFAADCHAMSLAQLIMRLSANETIGATLPSAARRFAAATFSYTAVARYFHTVFADVNDGKYDPFTPPGGILHESGAPPRMISRLLEVTTVRPASSGANSTDAAAPEDAKPPTSINAQKWLGALATPRRREPRKDWRIKGMWETLREATCVPADDGESKAHTNR